MKESKWSATHFRAVSLLLLIGALTNNPFAATASPGAVLAWGNNDFGQIDVPLEAQSGVTAIAAG